MNAPGSGSGGWSAACVSTGGGPERARPGKRGSERGTRGEYVEDGMGAPPS